MKTDQPLKYLTADNLLDQIKNFTRGMSVSQEKFTITVPRCTLHDLEWNHMDQMHRLAVHNTYEKGIRIATGTNFAISLTQWKNWPFFITVTDVYVAKGMFYQSLAIAGILFLHSIISMKETEANTTQLSHEWFLASHKLFRFLHKPFHKKLHKLNAKLQSEDKQLRQGRFAAREAGYRFKTDEPNYYNCNRLTANTIYPTLDNNACILLSEFSETLKEINIGTIHFLIKKQGQEYCIWPAICPHEGGPLAQGTVCQNRITCPWHGLQFSAVKLSNASPRGSRYGFSYELLQDRIAICQDAMQANVAAML